jgi:hypothetical protein
VTGAAVIDGRAHVSYKAESVHNTRGPRIAPGELELARPSLGDHTLL